MTGSPERPHTPKTADERTTLIAFLDQYRATLAIKCHGLTPGQLAQRAVPPSPLSLLGLVRHMAEVERGWFGRVAGEETAPRYFSDADPDGDFDNVEDDATLVEEAFAFWRAEIDHARRVTAAADLDQTFVHPRTQATFSLRWVLVHMIEEYARHCGHADFLRERIDGVTGD
jgi:uncharacterized damage-inducible protein DinB